MRFKVLIIMMLLLSGCGSLGGIHNPYKQDLIDALAQDSFDAHVTTDRDGNRTGYFGGLSWTLK